MKKTIISAFLILGIFTGFAFSQTKSRSTKTTIKKTTTRKTVTRKAPATKTTVIKKTMKTSNSAAITTETGLTYIITDRGNGAQLKAGDTVIIHYTGLLTNGQKFDSSLDRNEPLKFPLGAGRVIKGWDEGVQKLHVGDKATLIIPSALGYGSRGAGGVIPPDATLIFIVEVVGVE